MMKEMEIAYLVIPLLSYKIRNVSKIMVLHLKIHFVKSLCKEFAYNAHKVITLEIKELVQKLVIYAKLIILKMGIA